MSSGVRRHVLAWMPLEAPYMPVASVGILGALQSRDANATLGWTTPDDPSLPPTLALTTCLTMDEVAQEIADAPWPAIDRLNWPSPLGQAIKPMLKGQPEPARLWRVLAGLEDGRGGDPELATARKLVAALLTDGVLDKDGLPGRSRLLRGVKADLSSVAKPPRQTAEGLAGELSTGPVWRAGSSGPGLGLVPEVHTFGGTTGPEPSSVGAYSTLLYRLCWLGIMEMPPWAVTRGGRRVVGGQLFAGPDVMSWPVWRMPLRLRALTALFGVSAIHTETPDGRLLRARGIDAVLRSRARQINTMIAVFGWGHRVA